MRYHFKLDGLSSDHTNTLLSIESAMTGRSATALFELKTLEVYTQRDPAKAKAFVSSRLGVFLMEALEVLMTATGLDLIALYRAVKGIPVTLKARPVTP